MAVCGSFDNREEAFGQRLLDAMALMAEQYPSISVRFDAWRPMVVSRLSNVSIEDTPETWVRLGENIPGFVIDQPERFFQAGEGIINQTNKFCILPAGFQFRPDDHLVLMGTAYLMQEVTEQMGVCKIKLVREKSRYERQARGVPTNRLLGMKASIL